MPVALDTASEIGAAYRAIARRITGKSTAAPEIPREKTLFGKLFGGNG
jgi:septum formation inhibitor-activating ATPase MinD